MGGNTSSRVETCEDLISARGQNRSTFLRDCIKTYPGLDAEDFYKLFRLQNFCSMTADIERRVNKRYYALVRTWHPDKNPAEKKVECEAWTAKIVLARTVLLDPDLKRRYDRELQKHQGTWSGIEWYLRWGFNVLACCAGLAMVLAGALAVVPSGGASLGAAVAGSGILMEGVKGSIIMLKDEDCSWKEVLVGAAQGLAGGGISLAGAGAIAGSAVGVQAIAGAGLGAATTTTSQVIADGVDVALTEGWLGQQAKHNVSHAKSKEEVFCVENAKTLAGAAFLGAVAGAAVQSFTSVGTGTSLADDVANTAFAAQKAKDLPAALCPKQLLPRFLTQFAACATTQSTRTLQERVRALAPDLCHQLVGGGQAAVLQACSGSADHECA